MMSQVIKYITIIANKLCAVVIYVSAAILRRHRMRSSSILFELIRSLDLHVSCLRDNTAWASARLVETTALGDLVGALAIRALLLLASRTFLSFSLCSRSKEPSPSKSKALNGNRQTNCHFLLCLFLCEYNAPVLDLGWIKSRF